MSLYLSYGQSQIDQLEKVITEKNEEAERFRKHEHFGTSNSFRLYLKKKLFQLLPPCKTGGEIASEK